jgi:flavin-dependent dehydrogenase
VEEAMKTVTIAGGGLAGLSLGVALRNRGVPVVVHEAGSYPRHRVCGEFISGVSERTLEELGIRELLNDAKRHRKTRWFVGDREVCTAGLPEAALGISRHRLDLRLAEEFRQCGGELREGSRLPPEEVHGVVWAAGRKTDRGSDWLGLKVHVIDPNAAQELEMHMGKSGYAGVAPVEEGRVNVCGLFRRRAELKGGGVGLLIRYLERNGLQRLAERIANADVDEQSLTGVSGLRLGRQEVDPGRCVIGDAESIIPPFTGNGMSMAFEAAETAVLPLVDFAAGRSSWDAARDGICRLLRMRFRRRLTAATRLHPVFFSELGRKVLGATARSGLLPVSPLIRLLH